MKKTLLSFLLCIIYVFAKAQVPHGINYQAIARGSNGNELVNTPLQVKVSILSDTTGFKATGTGSYIWEEQQSVSTNAFGLFSIEVGNPLATKTQGTASTFSTIDWKTQPLFIGTKIYFQNAWKIMGSERLRSVPYAMIANNITGPVDKLVINGVSTYLDDALFEVKNNTGQTIFAVYNEGVRVYVDDGRKGSKGGFAIGGFDGTETSIQEYFRVTRDSTRIYINSDKGPKGGFSIGSFGNIEKSLLAVGTDVFPSTDNYSNLGSSTERWKTIYSVNGVINTSDVRLKRNIHDINYGLESIMQLKPISFTWVDDSEGRKHLGLIAQDVGMVISEVVDKGNNPDNILGINYSDLVPVLIKAIQDQQDQINSYKSENSELKLQLNIVQKEVERIQSVLLNHELR